MALAGMDADGGDMPAVLLVEDEILIRLASADWLREAGFSVIEAASGGEALALVRAGQAFALLVTDIAMPGEPDGAELIRIVRAMRPGLPVVIAASHLPERAAAATDRFVQKPYRPADLVGAVRELLGPGPRG